MLINLLVPPHGEHPELTTACSFGTPGGGRLYVGLIAEQERLKRWMADPGHEVWQSREMAPSMRVHLYGCEDFECFREICASLTMAGGGVLQIASQQDHTSVVISGEGDPRELTQEMRPLAERLGIDIAITAISPLPTLSRPGMILMDMDSTLIQCECIDEIGDFLGIKNDIAVITRRAMEGELDFTASLTERVKLLAGLDASLLHRVYDERVRLTPGAERLIDSAHKHGWKVGLVSGGFTFFTDRLRDALNLDYTRANTLEIVDGKLTGRVLGDIVDAETKRQTLVEQAKAWGIAPQQTVAIGDGANDLPMLQVAGLGVAFHAKPKVRELAPYALSHGGLDHILHLLGR